MTRVFQKGLAAALKRAPVVPVMVIENVADAVPLARALVKGGLPVLEITLRTASAMDCIRAIIAEVEGAIVGSGTVLTPEQLRDWLNAETWFNADQALEYGFATAIAGSDAAQQTAAAASASMQPRAWDLSAYARAPQRTAPANEITDDLTARQAALYDAVEKIAEDFGPFDTGTGPTGAHYVSAAENPFKPQGITCANCALYAGPRACEIVSGDIDPDAACKFWIIPQRLLTAPATPGNTPDNTFDRAAALRRLEACTIAYT